jgi:hypothetical protein
MHHFQCITGIHGFLKGLLVCGAIFPMFHQKFFVDSSWAKVWKSWTERGVLKVVCFVAIIAQTVCSRTTARAKTIPFGNLNGFRKARPFAAWLKPCPSGSERVLHWMDE